MGPAGNRGAVHGEARHLAEHARLALAHGVADAVVQKNGDVIRLAPGEPAKVDEVRVGRLVLDGDIILPADGATITERRRMGFGGLITVAVPVGADGQLAGTPLVRPFGVPVEEDRDDFIADATDAATRAFSPGEEEQVREAVRLAVRRCATLWTGKKPVVDVTLLQLANSHAMQLTSIIAIYFLFFAATAFALLPFGVHDR